MDYALYLKGLEFKKAPSNRGLRLIQRISSPQLVRREYMQLPMDDLRALNVAIDFFSAPPATKAQMLEDLQAAGFAVEPASASVMQPE